MFAFALLSSLHIRRRCWKGSSTCSTIRRTPLALASPVAESSSTPPIVFVLGGPGTGKGTQCALLQKEYEVSEICAGELLRQEANSGSELGRSISEIMQKGEIVPGHVTISLLRRELDLLANSCRAVLIDGFPRELGQSSLFEESIKTCEFVIFFKCDPEVMVERLRSRAKSSGRPDDVEDVFRRRIDTFYRQTMPVVEHFRSRGLLREVDSEHGDIQEVYFHTKKHFDDLFDKEQ